MGGISGYPLIDLSAARDIPHKRLMSFLDKLTSTDSRFSFIRCTKLLDGNDGPTQMLTLGLCVPGMTKNLSPWARVQASVTCAGVALRCSAIFSICATTFKISGKFFFEYLGTMSIQAAQGMI